MRLLFVHQHLGALGGAEVNILFTAGSLQKRGHATALLHGEATGHGEATWNQAFPTRFQLGVGSGHGTGSVGRALKEFAPDLICIQSMADLDVLETLGNCGVPVVRIVHDHGMYCMRGYKYNFLTRKNCTRAASPFCVFPCLGFVGRNRQGTFPLKWVSYRAKRKEILLNKRFQRLVVYSNHARRELIGNGFDEKKIEIHVPISCLDASGRLSSPTENNLILFVGQVIRGKGVDVLLQALARLRIRFECRIVGDGSHRPYCQRLSSRLGLSERVRFLGYVPRQRLEEYYLQASVLTVPSVWPEPLGFVGIEGMRYGLPVVAFDVGGIREWLIDGETGFAVPWMDTDQFAARIEQLLRDKELARKLGHRGVKFVNQKYDALRQLDNLENMFLRVIQEAHPSSVHHDAYSPEQATKGVEAYA